MDQKATFPDNRAATSSQYEEEIDLMEVVRLLLHHLWLIVLAFVVGATVVALCIRVFVTPKYTARSTIYVFSTAEDTTTATLNISNAMTKDFQILATTRSTINMAIEQLGLNTSYNELMRENDIQVVNPTGSHMLRIEVENRDPVMAANISNALANVLREQIADVMNTEKPSFVEMAVVPTAPSSPRTLRAAILAGAALAIVAAAFVLIRYFMNDTITTEDDVNRYLGLTILAAIPLERNLNKR